MDAFDGGDNLDSDMEGLKQDLTEMVLRVILSDWVDREAGICCSKSHGPIEGVQIYRSGERGCPKFIIPSQTLQFLRELRFSWTQISKLLGISRRTLFSIRQALGFEAVDPGVFSCISNSELQERIREIKRLRPDAGMRMVKGVLHSQGIHTSFLRVRDALYDVDPVGTTSRWASVVGRRQYSVHSPNSLWHIDGNHKLVR